MNEKELQTNNYSCKNCGGTLYFDAQTQNLKCQKCSTTYPIKKQKTFKKHTVQTNTTLNNEHSAWVNDNKVFKCKNCGSSVIANKNEMSNTCPYCGTALTLSPSQLPGIKPDCIIPFKFNKEQASVKFAESVKRKFFVNGAFKKQLPTSKIWGTYIPSFNFDINTSSNYQGVLYDIVKGPSGTSSKDLKPISGSLNKNYKDVLVESSSYITQPQLKGVLPYDISCAVDYDNNFILGYTVEHYTETLETCQKIAQTTVDALIRKDILNNYSYDGIDSLTINTKYLDKQYNYALVPIYRFEYNFKNKPYKTYMNGQTGKIDNNLPPSIPKIVMVVLLFMLFIILPIILALISD